MKYLSKYFKLFIALFKKKELIVKEESNTEKLLRLKEEYYSIRSNVHKLETQLFYAKKRQEEILKEIEPLEITHGQSLVFIDDRSKFNN